MTKINILSGLNIPSQISLDPKTRCINELTLKNLGPNDNLAYTYYKGLEVTCIEEGTKWEWKEVEINDEKLLDNDFIYPNGLIVDGIDYSNKIYNFAKINLNISPVSSVTQGIVNNTSLQELGGVDKLINGVRIGKGAGTGLYNTTFAVRGLEDNTTGNNNTSIGYTALANNITGTYNTSLGSFTMTTNTTGSFNTALGATSLYSTTNGSHNTGLGISTLYNNTTGVGNLAVGSGALSGTVGITLGSNSRNIALGVNAGNSIVAGNDNILIGADIATAELAGLLNGNNNITIGKLKTGFTTGSGNTLLGRITSLPSSLNNNVIISDGVGGIVFRSLDTGITTTPKQTNTLISGDSTGKAVIIKEYLPTVSGNYADDSAAALSGVLIGQMYHTSGIVKIRLS